MGCSLSAQGAKTSAIGAAKVIFPGGQIQSFYEPIKAADLMLQAPNFFLVSTASLHTAGQRISALKADDDLEMDQVYVLLPMKRLNSTVTVADMINAGGTAPGKAPPPECDVKDDDENCSLDLEDLDLVYRLCRCRSRKPSLETIVEETVNLRFLLMIES